MKRFACSQNGCPKSFVTKRDLRRHVDARHEDSSIHCPLCSKRFKGKRHDNLIRHVNEFCK